MLTKARQHRPVSLSLRVTAFVAVATTVLLLCFGWVIEHSIKHHFAQLDADELRSVLAAVQRSLELPAKPSDAALAEALAKAVSGHHGVFFLVADASGRKIYASSGVDLTSFAATAKPVGRITANTLEIWRDGKNRVYRGAVLRISPGVQPNAEPFTVAVATSIDAHQHYLNAFRHILWLSTLGACAVAILVTWFAVQRGHAPIRDVSAKIRGITSDQLHARLVPEQVPIEMAELVSSFNIMLERIEDSFRRLSNFSADIAHELRTPVTNLATQTQVALTKTRNAEEYREILYSNLEEYERMTKMISDMLFLAHTDYSQFKADITNVNLADEIQSLFEYFEAWAEDRGVHLSCESRSALVGGNRLMLRRALSNLISNAIRYTPAGQTVTVRLHGDARSVCVVVENPGQDIPAEHLPRLFDRFYRVDPSRQRSGDGAGLGLAIVKSVIDAHRGTLTVTSTGGRTRFSIMLPRVLSKTGRMH